MAQQEILTGRIREPVIEHDEPALPRLVGEDFRAWLRVWGNGELADNSIRARDAVWLLWSFAGLRATTLYRLAHEFRRRRVPLVPGMLWRLNITLHGFDVPPSVPIGGGLYVPHPVGTAVMAHRIGSNVTLVHGITIGMRNVRGFPTIADDVFIGAGARVLGEIRVGEGAKIGANAVVLTDVPAGATAVGVPAEIKLPASA